MPGTGPRSFIGKITTRGGMSRMRRCSRGMCTRGAGSGQHREVQRWNVRAYRTRRFHKFTIRCHTEDQFSHLSDALTPAHTERHPAGDASTSLVPSSPGLQSAQGRVTTGRRTSNSRQPPGFCPSGKRRERYAKKGSRVAFTKEAAGERFRKTLGRGRQYNVVGRGSK